MLVDPTFSFLVRSKLLPKLDLMIQNSAPAGTFARGVQISFSYIFLDLNQPRLLRLVPVPVARAVGRRPALRKVPLRALPAAGLVS